MLPKFLNWFSSTKSWKWFASKYIAHTTFRISGYPSFPMEDYFKIRDVLTAAPKGSVFTFASADTESLAAKIITRVTGGKFSHAGLILVDGPDDIKVLHMKADGPEVWHLLELLREIDFLAVNQVALDEVSAQTARNRIEWIMDNMDSIEYDYEQKLSNGDKFYCSEAAYFVLDGLADDPDLTPRTLLGRKVFDPDQVTLVGKILYTNHPHLINMMGSETLS